MSVQSEDFLEEILSLLKQTQTPDTNVQKVVLEHLEDILCFPDTNFYLAHILTKLKSENDGIRLLSGIVLKNNIRNYRSNLQHEVLEIVMTACLEDIGDPCLIIRRVIGDVISTIARGNEIKNWPHSLLTIFEAIDSSDHNLCDGGFTALHKICEDSQQFLETDACNDVLLILIPKCLQFMTPNVQVKEKIISQAMACLRPFALTNGPVMRQYLDSFIDKLYKLASYQDESIRCEACKILANLMEAQAICMLPHTPKIMDMMMLLYKDDSEELSSIAAEFWLNAARNDIFKTAYAKVLPTLLPIIVRNMRFSNTDEMLDLKNDADLPDRDEDIRPRFYEYDDQPIGHGADDSDEALEDFDGSLRAYSAYILQYVARLFQNECMPIVVPVLNEALCNSQWQVKESGIFAIGAVAKGYLDGMKPHFSVLFPHLLNYLQNSDCIQFRLICCWVFSCHATLIVAMSHKNYLEPTLEQLIQRMEDTNKRVQAAACGALSALQEAAGKAMLPYVIYLLRAVEFAFSKYQKSNIICLYDMLRTMANSLGQQLNTGEYVQIFMPILIKKWNSLDDNDRELIPLMMCLRSIAMSLNTTFYCYCAAIFPRCIRLVENILDEEVFFMLNMSLDVPNKEFKIVPLNLLAKLVECMGQQVQPLLHQKNVVQLVYICTFDKTPAVQCNAFDLLAQLARVPTIHLNAMGIDFFPALAASLEPESPRLCIHACNALIELSHFLGAKTAEGLDFVLDRFLCILDCTDAPSHLVQTVVVTMACLGYVCPIQVAPYMSYFIYQWLACIVQFKDERKQDMSFRGVCVMIALNPQAVFPCFDKFCKAIATLTNISDELRSLIYKVCHGIRTQISNDKWQEFVSRLAPEIKERLQALYQV